MPVTIDYPHRSSYSLSSIDEDNIISALEQAGRVHRVNIFASQLLLSKVATVMQKTFPVLTHLELEWDREGKELTIANAPVLPKGFLNESAPCLQYLVLGSFPFPEVPTFLLSSHNLLTLKLELMFQNSFVLPKATAEWLSGMPRLKRLSISFWYANRDLFAFDEERTRLDTTRVIFPSLTYFHYAGHSGYLGNFIAQIDAPLLIELRISCGWGRVPASQLFYFISHTENLKFDQFSRASAQALFRDSVTIDLGSSQWKCPLASLEFTELDSFYIQVPEIANIVGQFGTFSNVDHLSFDGSPVQFRSDNDMGSAEWLPFFRLFPAVEVLQLSGALGENIASALEGTTEDMVTEVFPTLHEIWIEDDYSDDEDYEVGPMELRRFLSLRQRSGHPVIVIDARGDDLAEILKKLESHRNGQQNVL